MKSVFFLEHLHMLGEGDESVKALGIYSSREAALAAVERFRKLPGFWHTPQMADHSKPGPGEGFNIDEYEVDQDNWSEGFETL